MKPKEKKKTAINDSNHKSEIQNVYNLYSYLFKYVCMHDTLKCMMDKLEESWQYI